MENAGFYVIMSEVSILENEIFLKEQQWNTHLETAKQQVSDYILFLERQNRGVLAEKIQDYYREVHQYLLNGLGCVMSELSMRVLQYAEGLYEIEGDYEGRIRQEELQEQADLLEVQRGFLCSLVEEADTALKTIPDYGGRMPSTEAVEAEYAALDTLRNRVASEIETYESAHLPDMDNVEEMLSCLRKFIELYKGKPEAGLQNYESSSLLKSPEGKRLMEAQEAYAGYVERNMDKLDRLREQRTERLIRQREEQGKEQFWNGIKCVAGGVANIGMAVYTAPVTAMEIAAVAVMGITGDIMIVYGVSESVEGANNIKLARQGDIETEAYNPLKAAIPYLKENPDVYYGILQKCVELNAVSTTVYGGLRIYRMGGMKAAVTYEVTNAAAWKGGYVTSDFMVDEMGMSPEVADNLLIGLDIVTGIYTHRRVGKVADIYDVDVPHGTTGRNTYTERPRWNEGGTGPNRIPDNNSTTGHIFRDAEGHIPDTPENRALLENVANNAENFRGTDKYGNEWYTKVLENGKEVWVESRNGNIFEGGINENPKPWNPDTGLKKQ